MLLSKNKKKGGSKNGGNRILVSITVLGSAGPIRFVVNEEDIVASVIDTALKAYAKEGRLPVLGSNIAEFMLSSPFAGHEALRPWDVIGALGVRNFMLSKKPESAMVEDADRRAAAVVTRKGSWKSWINKSLNLKISSH